MNALRRLVARYPQAAALVMGVVLCVKLLVPGGYMPVVANGRIMAQICTGIAPATASVSAPMTMAMSAAMPGMHHETDGSDDHRKAQMPCAFAGLGLTALGGVDAVVLAEAIAFVLALGFAATAYRPRRVPAFLRPPLRGPPVTA